MSEEEKSAAQSEDRSDKDATEPHYNVQTLTDLFDQLDRAAFKRVLDYRDSIAAPRDKPTGTG